MRWPAVSMLALACVACGRIGFDDGTDDAAIPFDPVEVPQYVSGSRLLQRIADFGGTARHVLGWHDAQLGVDCTRESAADGSTRCLPVSNGTNIVYRDAACTQPIVVWNGVGAPPAGWARTLQSGMCGSTYRFRTIGTEITNLSAYYFLSTGTTCLGPASLGGSNRLYEAGATETSPDIFVRFEPIRRGTGRLQAVGWQGDDDSLELTELYDSKLDALCSVAETADGRQCVPRGPSADFGYYSDAACTQPLTARSACDPQGRFAVRYSECGQEAVHLGASYAGPVFLLNAGACEATTSMFELFELGSAVAPGELVAGTEVDEPSGGRLAIKRWLGSEGSRVAIGWRDTQRANEGCSPGTNTSFTGVRCTPVDATASDSEYVDASCTTPLAERAPTCRGTIKYIYAFDTRGLFPHLVDTTASQPSAYYRFAGSCGGAMALDPTKQYVVGLPQAVSWDAFAVANEVRE